MFPAPVFGGNGSFKVLIPVFIHFFPYAGSRFHYVKGVIADFFKAGKYIRIKRNRNRRGASR